MRYNPSLKTESINTPEMKNLLENFDGIIFENHRDTRRQVKLRMLKTQEKDDRFTAFIIAETEAKKLLAGWLLFLFILFLIALVI